MKISECEIGKPVEMILKFTKIQYFPQNRQDSQEYASITGLDCDKRTIDVRIWKVTDEIKKHITENGIYLCKGKIKLFNDKKQFMIDNDGITEANVNPDDYLIKCPLEINELQIEISRYIRKIQNDNLRNIVTKAIMKIQNEYFSYPAAVSIHHNYLGGIAYHVYSMLTLSEVYLKQYKYFNSDLVYAGIIIHDMGKVKELSGVDKTTYTAEGNLLGHITIGVNMLHDVCKELSLENTEEALALEHIILSHHGKQEYGSPIIPKIPEAALIFILDYSDSRFASLSEIMKQVKPGEYTEPVFAFDKRIFYIPNIK